MQTICLPHLSQSKYQSHCLSFSLCSTDFYMQLIPVYRKNCSHQTITLDDQPNFATNQIQCKKHSLAVRAECSFVPSFLLSSTCKPILEAFFLKFLEYSITTNKIKRMHSRRGIQESFKLHIFRS